VEDEVSVERRAVEGQGKWYINFGGVAGLVLALAFFALSFQPAAAAD